MGSHGLSTLRISVTVAHKGEAGGSRCGGGSADGMTVVEEDDEHLGGEGERG